MWELGNGSYGSWSFGGRERVRGQYHVGVGFWCLFSSLKEVSLSATFTLSKDENAKYFHVSSIKGKKKVV